jgi:hypothetical protein
MGGVEDATQMSAMTRHREENIAARQVRMALYCLLLGDELFRRAWPAEPLLAP